MVSVMTTHPSSMVAHAGGKLCEHLTGTQARYPSIDLVLRYEVKTRPSPRTDFRTMSGVLDSGPHLVDRLLHHAHVCQTTADSVRLSHPLAGQGVSPLS
jgi:hypothetical protein